MSLFKKVPSHNPTSQLYFAVAPGVWGTKDVFVNMYFVESGEGWVLVDAGLPSSHNRIRKIAAELFGEGVAPACILLTHGHFDHVSSVKRLAEEWGVPVYAHALEAPFLTGQSAYPPPDPTVGGGVMPVFSMLFPRKPIDISEHLQTLPEDGSVPALPSWRWIHVPGHSPGQVAFFREEDRVLLAADAFVTTRQESAMSIARQTPVMSGPPRYFTIDWDAAEQSVRSLADLEPEIVATGHGRPLCGPYMRQALRTLSDNFQQLAVPSRGRYVDQPALWDESGVVYIPKRDPRQDRVVWALIGLTAVTGLVAYALSSRGKKKRRR